MIDLILFFILLRVLKNVDDLIPYWLAMSALLLFFLISLYRIGYWNDWFIRGYNPLMCIVLMSLLRRLSKVFDAGKWRQPFFLYLLLTVMGLGLILPVSHIFKSMKSNVVVSRLFPDTYPFSPAPYDVHPNIYQATIVDSHSGIVEARQYLSAKGSFYERYLARRNYHADKPEIKE